MQLPKSDKGTNRGFGFVEFNSKDQAEKAIGERNNKMWKGRTLSVAFSVPKASYEAKLEHVAANTKLSKQEAALPKVLRDEKKKALADKEEKKQALDKKKAEQDKLEKIRAKKKAKKLAKEPVEEKPEDSCTLFVRNIGFETTQEKFKEFVERFGQVAYAVLCKADGGESHRGSGFVKFKRREDAQQLLTLSSKVEENLDKERRNTRLDHKSKPGLVSSLSLLQGEIELDGRRLIVKE